MIRFFHIESVSTWQELQCDVCFIEILARGLRMLRECLAGFVGQDVLVDVGLTWRVTP